MQLLQDKVWGFQPLWQEVDSHPVPSALHVSRELLVHLFWYGEQTADSSTRLKLTFVSWFGFNCKLKDCSLYPDFLTEIVWLSGDTPVIINGVEDVSPLYK